MQTKIDQVKAKVAHCIQLAQQKLGINLPTIDVRFDLRGRAAGQAGRITHINGFREFYVRFNVHHISSDADFEHLLNSTVPHEIAHSVCQAFPHLGDNHDAGWKRICIMLGGNGSRCYSAEDAPDATARLKPIIYTATNGKQVRVTKVIHGKIQRGKNYIEPTGGRLTRDCQYSLAVK